MAVAARIAAAVPVGLRAGIESADQVVDEDRPFSRGLGREMREVLPTLDGAQLRHQGPIRELDLDGQHGGIDRPAARRPDRSAPKANA
jgi:hypothetical protein